MKAEYNNKEPMSCVREREGARRKEAVVSVGGLEWSGRGEDISRYCGGEPTSRVGIEVRVKARLSNTGDIATTISPTD